MSSIGEKLSALRKQRGWTLKQLSSISGVSVSYISAIENETRPTPSLYQIGKLARALGVPVTYFEDEAATTTGPETHQTQADFAQFLRLYDEETRRFIVSEQSRPYVALAMRLAQQEAEPDVPTLLQIIAQFMREQKQEYRAHP